MEDGLILMYVKDGTIYPVALSQEQLNVFRLIQNAIPQPITVVGDHPIGKAVNLARKEEKTK